MGRLLAGCTYKTFPVLHLDSLSVEQLASVLPALKSVATSNAKENFRARENKLSVKRGKQLSLGLQDPFSARLSKIVHMNGYFRLS